MYIRYVPRIRYDQKDARARGSYAKSILPEFVHELYLALMRDETKRNIRYKTLSDSVQRFFLLRERWWITRTRHAKLTQPTHFRKTEAHSVTNSTFVPGTNVHSPQA